MNSTIKTASVVARYWSACLGAAPACCGRLRVVCTGLGRESGHKVGREDRVKRGAWTVADREDAAGGPFDRQSGLRGVCNSATGGGCRATVGTRNKGSSCGATVGATSATRGQLRRDHDCHAQDFLLRGDQDQPTIGLRPSRGPTLGKSKPAVCHFSPIAPESLIGP